MSKRGVDLGIEVVSKMLSDPNRARTVMSVVGQVQRGKERLDAVTHRARNVGRLPSAEDVERIGRHVGALRREVRRLKTRLESIRRRVETL